MENKITDIVENNPNEIKIERVCFLDEYKRKYKIFFQNRTFFNFILSI